MFLPILELYYRFLRSPLQSWTLYHVAHTSIWLHATCLFY